MLGNLLNGIPIVGHAKGLVHHLTGNRYEADRAIMAATRTTVVMAGGAAGIVGGPAGVIAGATGAGLLLDSATSIASGRPQGVLEGVNDIVTDIENGDIPVGSVVKTGLFVGADALSGFGGGCLASSATGVVGKSIAKDATLIIAKNGAACQLAAVGGVTRKVAENAPRSYPRAKQPSGQSHQSSSSTPTHTNTSSESQPPKRQSKSSNTSGSGSGSQPPRDPNRKKKQEKDQGESHLAAFLSIFNVSSLDGVLIRGVYIFRNLQSGQLKALKKLIKQLRLNGCLARVVETVRNLFNKMEIGDVTFQNFLSLAQFVAAYIQEQVAQRNEAQKGGEHQTRSYEERRQENQEAVSKEPSTRSNILTTFMDLYAQISRYCCEPNFRNIFSAIYHYFKHKMIPETSAELSITDYYTIITFLLERVKTTREYADLTSQQHPRRELVFDRIFEVFGLFLRIRLVLKIQDGSLELSSCYIVDDNVKYVNDDEGDEFIDPDKDRD